MTEAIVSSKYEIVIPHEARKALGLKPGDKLLVAAQGDKIIVLQKPKSYWKAISGMGRRLYPRDYLKEEREGWE